MITFDFPCLNAEVVKQKVLIYSNAILVAQLEVDKKAAGFDIPANIQPDIHNPNIRVNYQRIWENQDGNSRAFDLVDIPTVVDSAAPVISQLPPSIPPVQQEILTPPTPAPAPVVQPVVETTTQFFPQIAPMAGDVPPPPPAAVEEPAPAPEAPAPEAPAPEAPAPEAPVGDVASGDSPDVVEG
jgi:hypothetical protein